MSVLWVLQVNNQPPKDMLDQACSTIASDVVDICTAFIQKTAVERAVPEMDKRLSSVSSLFKSNVTANGGGW